MKDFEELIDAYLRNELSKEERTQFEVNIQHNVELQNQFNEIYEIRQGIKYGSLATVSRSLRDLEDSHTKKDKPWFPGKWILVLSILSLVSIGLYFFLNNKPDVNDQRIILATKFDSEEFDQYIYHKSKRAIHAPSELTNDQKIAYNLYSIQSFEATIPLLENLWKSEKDTLAYYYLGVSHYAINKHDKAKSILKSTFLKDYNNPMD